MTKNHFQLTFEHLDNLQRRYVFVVCMTLTNEGSLIVVVYGVNLQCKKIQE